MKLIISFVCVVFVNTAYASNEDGGKAPRLPLNDGSSIPAIGLGTFLGFDENGPKKLEKEEVEKPVTWALDAGYRMVDTASEYHNEDQVGLAIQKSKVPREHVFVVTKLGLSEQRHVVESLRNSLKRLNMSYVDLYLIHNPVAFKPDHSGFDVIDYVDTWKGMEEAKKLGLAKSIGISNFNISQIERLMANSEVKPAVLQVEASLYLAQNKLLDFCKKRSIVVMGYSPLRSLVSESSEPSAPRNYDPVVMNIAKKYGKTTPQIVLRYLVEKGVVPIPKSVNKNRIEENIDIFDFSLTPEEKDTLAKLNKDYRAVFPSSWQDHPFYPFERTDTPEPDPFKKVNV